MKRKVFLLLIIVFLLVVAMSCRNSVESGRTRLALHIEQDNSRTIMPSQTLMETKKYSISGLGPSGSSFGPILSTDSELSVNDLIPGVWTITAKALNAENNELATGSSQCTISAGNNSATIVLDRITGSGTLELDFRWNEDICDEQQMKIGIELEDSEGNIISRNKDVYTSEGHASMILSLDAGCHVLSVRVSSSKGNLGIGATDAVRIVSNTRSAGIVELKGSKPEIHSGTSFSFENAVGKPMNFYIDYYPKSPSKGQKVTLKACYFSLPEDIDPEDLAFQWYKDGVLQAAADGFSFLITAESGVHRYDVIVRSRKVGTMCGASLTLSIPY
ncbi:MAG: hypothetical protein IJS84_09895 [Spirochaetales bacterium]|nr:hypothetical protein [Spirochaetales bacterium]